MEHSHPPNPERVEVVKSRAGMKRAARNTAEKTHNILTENIAGLSDETLAQMTKPETLRRDIRRHKRPNQPPVPVVNNTLFALPPQYTLSSTGNNFLLYDNNIQDRLLLFGTQQSIDFLENCGHWFMDGTFNASPLQFAQIYTIHGFNNGRNIPCVYALLPNKRANTYAELLHQIQRLTNNAIPANIAIDFEMAMIQALGQVYPYSPAWGCLFHLSKNVFKRVKELGLQQRYVNDPVFRGNIRMIAALSFVPTQDVIAAFNSLCQHCGNDEQLVLDYFETNYIGELRRGRRIPPRFDHALWNVTTRVQQNLPRTNNYLEGWHNRLSGMLNSAHPSIWECIDVLKKDSALNHMLMAQMVAGAPPPLQKRVYRDVNTSIQALLQGYQLANVIAFLRGISYNLAAF